jgi:hypothetical protein
MSGTPTSAAAYSSEGSTLAVPSVVPTSVSRTAVAPAPRDVIPASLQPRAKAGRLPGVDKEASDTINVIILQAILAENRMVRCFLRHKAGSKYFKKDVMTSLMNGLAKHSHPVVKGLSESRSRLMWQRKWHYQAIARNWPISRTMTTKTMWILGITLMPTTNAYCNSGRETDEC